MVADHARTVARDASSEILESNGSLKLANGVASAKTISAIERLARADRQHAAETGGTGTLTPGSSTPHPEPLTFAPAKPAPMTAETSLPK